MYELKKKIGKMFTSKFVGTGPSSYEKRIYRSALSQRLRITDIAQTTLLQFDQDLCAQGFR
jgi:hypothetical protein